MRFTFKTKAMEKQLQSIQDLIAQYYDELDQRGYGRSSQLIFRKICNSILIWCSKTGVSVFNESVANRYCDENIGGHIWDISESLNYKKTIRVTRMLVNLSKGEDFEFRSPMKEYFFESSLKKYKDEYLSFCLNERRLSNPSVEQRKLAIYRFDIFLTEHKFELYDLNTNSFEDFFASKHCTKSSRRQYKTIIRELYRYFYEKKILSKDLSTLILKEPKVHHTSKILTTYTEDEIKRMINAVSRSSAKGKRDYLVLLLAAEYGWRASDITSFKLEQIDWDRNIISLVQNKTGVAVEFPLLASIGNAIIEYIKFGRPQGGDDVIIVSHENTHKGQKLKSPTIHSIVSNAMRIAKIDNWKEKKHGPHALRHSLATNMLKQNISLPIISTVLGHQSTETTKMYLQVDIQKLRLCGLQIPRIKSKCYQKEVAK